MTKAEKMEKFASDWNDFGEPLPKNAPGTNFVDGLGEVVVIVGLNLKSKKYPVLYTKNGQMYKMSMKDFVDSEWLTLVEFEEMFKSIKKI